MGRNRTPTSILDAKGAFNQNPQRARPNEPHTDRPIGSPPRYLTDAEKKVWKDLVDEALPGVLMYSDRTQFEILVRLKTRMISDFWEMTSAEKALMVSLGSKFAGNPADRSKVSVEQPKESKLSQFMNRRPAAQPQDEPIQ